MKDIIVQYKAIFQQDGQQDTIAYKAQGKLHQKEETTTITFKHDQEIIEIQYDLQHVILKHGQSLLYFQYDQDCFNQYQLPYGTINMTTRLLKFSTVHQNIHMKYQLLQQNEIISTVYLMLQVQEL